MAQSGTLGQAEFLGSDLTLPISGNFQVIAGLNLLIQDIEQLCLTTPGERVGRPEYGCLLRTRLWENIDDVANQGTQDIQQAIAQFEPRVTVLDVTSTIFRDDGIVLFTIRIVVNATNQPLNFVLPFRSSAELIAAS